MCCGAAASLKGINAMRALSQPTWWMPSCWVGCVHHPAWGTGACSCMFQLLAVLQVCCTAARY
jgi:hypothetical protein